MIHDENIGFLRLAPCFREEAVIVERALGAKAILFGRRDKRPDHCVFRDVAEFRAIPCLARAAENLNISEVADIFLGRHPVHFFQPLLADVVRAPLKEHRVRVKVQRFENERQVL